MVQMNDKTMYKSHIQRKLWSNEYELQKFASEHPILYFIKHSVLLQDEAIAMQKHWCHLCLCTVPFAQILKCFVLQHVLLESLSVDPPQLTILRLLSQLGEKSDKERVMWQSNIIHTNLSNEISSPDEIYFKPGSKTYWPQPILYICYIFQCTFLLHFPFSQLLSNL